MTPPPGLHEILRAAAPPERAGVPGVAVLDAAPDRRDAGVQRVEDRVLEPLPRRSFEKNPSTAFITALIWDAEVGVKWNVQSGWPFSHSRTSAERCDDTLSRMTCTGVPGSIPSAPLSATWSRKARNSSSLMRAVPLDRPPDNLPRAACSRGVRVSACPGVMGSRQSPRPAP